MTMVVVALAAYASDCLAMATTEEAIQCCKEMAGQCGDMGMPASHSCCQKVVKPMQAALKTSVPSLAVDTLLASIVEEWDAVLNARRGGLFVPSHFYSPPHSPPLSIEILRI